MQEKIPRRSNRERTATTRAALINAARTLFVEAGYHATGTPEIVAAARVTRGALYHHFDDKAALFRAVVEAEAKSVAAEIVAATDEARTAREALAAGTDAYFSAMAKPGRTRLLLIDGPAVLGPEVMRGIDAETGTETLRQGIAGLLDEPEIDASALAALADMLGTAFDRAALAAAAGAEIGSYRQALDFLFEALARSAKR
jgi:AcrR family transcriptional regulator